MLPFLFCVSTLHVFCMIFFTSSNMILEQTMITFLVKLKEDSNLGINQVGAMVFCFFGWVQPLLEGFHPQLGGFKG